MTSQQMPVTEPFTTEEQPFTALDVIYNEDCSVGIDRIPDHSVDLVVTDPPYFRIMTEDWKGKKYGWDKQWDSLDDYLTWFDNILEQFNRVLKPNGSIYIYADDEIAAHVQVLAEKRFHLINNIVWKKTNGMNSKYWRNIRKYAATTERILFFEKRGGVDLSKTGWQEILDNKGCFRSIKDYLISERDRVMKDKGMDMAAFRKWFTELTETDRMEYHYFGDYQWCMPTEEIYAKMQTSGYWSKEYKELREEYEELRRPFFIDRNYTDVWESPMTTTMEGKTLHPTQKPVDHIERMIKASSNENAVVLDPFMGSGTTAVACIHTERHFIGFEKDAEYYKIAESRIKEEKDKKRAFRTLEEWSEYGRQPQSGDHCAKNSKPGQ